MENVGIGGARTKQWLRPSEALNRLQLDDEEIAAGDAVVDHEQLRYGTKAGSVGILLPRDAVSEVTEGATIYDIPKTAPWMEGLVNLRGNLIPVFHLARLLDTEDPDSERSVLVVVDKGENALGLLVNGLPRLVTSLRPITQPESFPDMLKDYFRGGYAENDEVWLDIDLPSFIESLADEIGA